jgi:5-methyltetrahydrofolate--homocysteine methyltransferase
MGMGKALFGSDLRRSDHTCRLRTPDTTSVDPLRRVPIAHKLALARDLRNNPTPGERHTWSLLRRRQIRGLKFRRQHVLHGFIVDFYCAKLRLVIEIDGEPHENRQNQEYDVARAEWLESAGYTVIRLTNQEVTRKRLSGMIGGVLKTGARTPSSFPRSRRERGSGGED